MDHREGGRMCSAPRQVLGDAHIARGPFQLAERPSFDRRRGELSGWSLKVLWLAEANLRPKKRQFASNVGPPLPGRSPGIRLLTDKTEPPDSRFKETYGFRQETL